VKNCLRVIVAFIYLNPILAIENNNNTYTSHISKIQFQNKELLPEHSNLFEELAFKNFERAALEREEIYINSDRLTVNRVDNTATFEGEVIVWFEDLVLKTSNLIAFFNENNTLKKIIIPKKLIARRAPGNETIVADNAEYYANDLKLILKGNINIEREGKLLAAEEVIYYAKLKNIQKGK
jgi:lipopolysaccharide transport protein LptA